MNYLWLGLLISLSACNYKADVKTSFDQVTGDLEVVRFISAQGQPRFLVNLKTSNQEESCYIPAQEYFNTFQHTSSLPLHASFSGVFIKEENKVSAIELRTINEEKTILIKCIPN